MKKIYVIIPICFVCVIALIATTLILFSGIHSRGNRPRSQKSPVFSEISNLHNGDAKFYKDYVITNVRGILTIYNMNGKFVRSYPEVAVNWLDCLPEKNTIIYSNAQKQVGILTLDNSLNIRTHRVVKKSSKLQIDPTLLYANRMYYMTTTEISGNVNNANPRMKNGKYTVTLYKSKNLTKWSYVSRILSEKRNIEDLDIFFEKNRFHITYEKETVDKGNSSVHVITSRDRYGKSFSKPRTLIKATCDHEPASIERNRNGYRMYYSCDKKAPGTSYMGAHAYYADFNKDFRPKRLDRPIKSKTKKGILLYDTKMKSGKLLLLYAHNYLTDCDLMIEEVSS